MRKGWGLLILILMASGGCDKQTPEKGSPQQVLPVERTEKKGPESSKAQPGPTASSQKPEAQVSAEKTGPPPPQPYSAVGQPDPFQPAKASMAFQKEGAIGILPLEQFETTEFELVGIVHGPGIIKALVQDLTGKGFYVQVGTLIGKKGGKVVLIANKEVVIEEPFQDFMGKKKVRKVSLKIP